MDIILSVFLPLALAIIMFSLGLGLTVADFSRVAREPKAFAIGAVAQLVLLPIVAYLTVVLFGLSGELAVGLMILSFCPGGVTSNILTRFAKGDLALSISLTGVISLVSVVSVPLLVGLAAGHFMGVDAPPVDVTALGLAMFAITAVPVILGMLVRHFVSGFAAVIETPVSHLATVLFCVVVAGALASNWSLFVANLPVLGPAVVALNVVLLAIGTGLASAGGLDRRQSSAIAIETGIQNATLGITVGSLIAEQASGLPPFSLPSGVYGITMYLVSVPFVLWRRRAAG
ncbi:bile acid:sodium symporter family protein [Nitratireductor mangrovi]|uniref:Bile acid:sodium symporter family protein n=1 Tax=Nitratireductor mangrovi TaxID=2599600 RepID=A0A5B8L3T2_9HYPH|nr:bile acid:sodium symporter family protein [Nitratireductor mangrovi]QDZ02320.1 bile acid:sodium symporter family protein [Nitratireductor mangrovi]